MDLALEVWVVLLGGVPLVAVLTDDVLFGVVALAFALPPWLMGLPMILPLLLGVPNRAMIEQFYRTSWRQVLLRTWAIYTLAVVVVAVGILEVAFVLMAIVNAVADIPTEQKLALSLIIVSLVAAVWIGRESTR